METCAAYVREVLSFDTVFFMMSSIGEIEGLPFDVRRVRCVEKMPSSMQAGYLWTSSGGFERGSILIDASKASSKAIVERNIKHELIHAFDDARGALDPQDCYHQACSEIRAARLSGDCSAGREVQAGQLDLLAAGAKCVEKRAIMAVENNSICRGFSERAVQKLLSSCYADSAPFSSPIPFSGDFDDKLR